MYVHAVIVEYWLNRDSATVICTYGICVYGVDDGGGFFLVIWMMNMCGKRVEGL